MNSFNINTNSLNEQRNSFNINKNSLNEQRISLNEPPNSLNEFRSNDHSLNEQIAFVKRINSLNEFTNPLNEFHVKRICTRILYVIARIGNAKTAGPGTEHFWKVPGMGGQTVTTSGAPFRCLFKSAPFWRVMAQSDWEFSYILKRYFCKKHKFKKDCFFKKASF